MKHGFAENDMVIYHKRNRLNGVIAQHYGQVIRVSRRRVVILTSTMGTQYVKPFNLVKTSGPIIRSTEKGK